MKKILTTLAGTVSLALVLGACSAVDTTETKSIAPVAAPATSSAAQSFKFDRRLDMPSRSATRPVKPVIFVKPGVSHHQNHVNHVKVLKAAKDARIAKAKKAAAAKAVKVNKPKVYKKTVFKKSKKVVRKVTGAGLSGIARCIGKYESGNNPKAQNRTTTASGYYQFVNGTWNGYGGYKRAKDAPLSVQTAKFKQVWAGGKGAHHWVVAHKCGY